MTPPASGEPPTTGEAWRRMDSITDELRSSFRAMNERLDKMPTNDLLVSYLTARDQRVTYIEQDVAKLDARIDGVTKDLVAQRRWLVGTAIAALGVMVALVTLLRSVVA